MRARSLLIRLGCAAALLITLAMALGGIGLTLIFDRQIERGVAAELDLHLKTLAAQSRLDENGNLVIDALPPEPRFEQPYSGLYWQIDGPAIQQTRSRSLWDFVMHGEPAPGGNKLDMSTIAGPENVRLLSLSRSVVLPYRRGETTLTITVAVDENDLAQQRREFLALLVPSLLALGIVLALAMAGFIHLALAPFRKLRADLAQIHAGHSRVLSRDVPDEVRPVVDDLNRLIGFQDAAVERAQAQAGDLAHGLKTPLAVLGAMAREARDQGQDKQGKDIEEQVEAMRRHVDRALARARAGLTATLGYQSTDVANVARKTVRMLKTLPDAGALAWKVEIPNGLAFLGDDGDLTELLGNVLDNARKWAASRVDLHGQPDGDHVVLTIDDDGPGMSEEDTEHIERGKRWDEKTPGTGFGLAITRDLVSAYRGTLALQRSPLGGLRIIITLPRAMRLT